MLNASARRVDRCSMSIFRIFPSRVGIVISPAGSRSVLPRQPGLKVVVSPSRVEIVISPTGLKIVVSPAEVCVGSCFPSEVPKWIGFSGGRPSVRIIPFPSRVEMGVTLSSSAEFLEIPSRVPGGGYFLCIHHLEKHSILHH